MNTQNNYLEPLANDNEETLRLLNIRSIRVTRLILTEAGIYNTFYERPYETEVNYNVQEALNAFYNNDIKNNGYDSKVSAMSLNSAAPNLVVPSAIPKAAIAIPNGWNTPRFRFMLEVEVEAMSTMVYFIQGYSDYMDLSHNGLIDPNMTMYINSIISVSRTYMNDGGIRDIVVSNDNVIYNASDIQTADHHYTIRPMDVFNGIESSYIGNYNDESFSTGNSNYVDTRSRVTNMTSVSSRSNNVGSQYASSLINATLTSRNLTDIGSSSSDMFSKAKSIVGENNLFTNPIIRLLAMGNDKMIVNNFRFDDLNNIDPSVVSKTNVINATQGSMNGLNMGSYTETWDKTDTESVAATMLSNGVTFLMSKYLLGKIDFSITNKTLDGSYAIFIAGCKSFINGDTMKYIEAFKDAVIHELMPTITNNNCLQVEINIRADVYKDVWVAISVNDGPTIEYASPSFCDSLTTPIITTNEQSYYGIVSDFESVLSQFD